MPINAGMEFKSFESKKGNKKFVFDYTNVEFSVDDKSTIRIMIDVTDEGDKCSALLFLDYLSKLLYQSKT
jgi:hypothetical protein